MQKLPAETQKDVVENASSGVPAEGKNGRAALSYTITVECRATIQETWVLESDRPLTIEELEDELFMGNMR